VERKEKKGIVLSWMSGLRDLSVIVAICGLGFTYLGHKEKVETVSQNTAVAKSIASTMQRINQDIVFRSDAQGPDVGEILSEYSRIASGLAPNDPFVATYAMYTRLVGLVRDPQSDDANELLALSIYPDELRDNYPDHFTIVEGIYEDWMLYSGVGMLNLIVKGRTSSRAQELALFDRSHEVLESAFNKSKERSDHRRALAIGAVIIQHALRGAQFSLPPKGAWDAHLVSCEELVKQLKGSENWKEQLTGYDGDANIEHLKGQYSHIQGDYDAAVRFYEASLAKYDDLALKFPQRANHNEVKLVNQHIKEARKKIGLGELPDDDENAEQMR